jgi:hypothetical protein
VVYYQINYTLTDVPEDCAYFHAQFRRTNPPPYKDVYTILDGVRGQRHCAGVYMAWGVNNSGRWGEIKFYLDLDREFPTIAGTGTEDYFCGAYNFDPGSLERRQRPDASRYEEFSAAYAGLPQVIRPDGVYQSQQRFGMYRWHVMDPVRFRRDLRITIQALGWRMHRELQYLPLPDDIASCAFWHQAHRAVSRASAPRPARGDPERREPRVPRACRLARCRGRTTRCPLLPPPSRPDCVSR